MTPAIQRLLIAAVQVLGLAVWFSVSAVVPSLTQDWGISANGAVWLTASVQLGFVAGAVVSTTLNLADRVPPHLLLAASAAAAAVCTLAVAFWATGLDVAVPLRFLTGVFLAGVYPVGMKLMASWSERAARGKALGILVGALTLGSALPHLISGLGSWDWQVVLVVAAAASLTGAVVAALCVRPGPHAAASAPVRNASYAIGMFRDRGPRLANLGYFGHMWELYALWTWIPSFLRASPAADGLPVSAEVAVFATMGLAGVAGCLVGGWGADRFGRSPAAVTALVLSGLCCLVSPLAFGAAPVVLLVFCAVWGAAVIADSGVFSTALSETADARYVGTALTAQTALGFGLTVVSIQLVPLAVDMMGWRWAFLVLVPGPVLGAIAMRSFGRRRATHQEVF
ncbi:MFS transporter [Prauserella cavernicola]|uniref:MFS transporter n=1 Tax=Prauserella cavernicola TaxID=2800127 RepID=A0A934QWC4_9PSEU|nr:MFS transporter [Prauserella cavernicola]MBK1787815.1 MFS transporter [Prauserella cavernicola]